MKGLICVLLFSLLFTTPQAKSENVFDELDVADRSLDLIEKLTNREESEGASTTHETAGHAVNSTHNSSHTNSSAHGGHGHHHVNPWTERLSVFAILTVLVLLSISFEFLMHHLKHGTKAEFLPIILHLESELVVLGFLSVLTFVSIRTGILGKISEKVFHDEEHLIHMTETVHMALFMVMVSFLFLVVLILFTIRLYNRNLHTFEMNSRTPDQVKARFSELAKTKYGVCDFIRKSELSEAEENLQYMWVRQEFLEPRDDKPLPLDFNFDRYIELQMGATVAHLIHINITTWVFLWLIFAAYIAIMIAPTKIHIYVYVASSWVLLLGLLIIYAKLKSVWGYLVRPIVYNTSDESAAILIEEKNPQFLDIPLKKSRNFFQNRFPNRHEHLFWGGVNGPSILQFCLRLVLVCTSLYIAVLFLVYYDHIEKEFGKPWNIILIIVALLPLGILVGMMPMVISKFVWCTSIEYFRNRKNMETVHNAMKAEKSQRALKMVHFMQSRARQEMKEQREKGLVPKPEFTPLTEKQLLLVRETFEMFDLDESGNIDSYELGAVCNHLGYPVMPGEEIQLMHEIDKNGDGDVSLDEFIDFVTELYHSRDEDPETSIQSLFKMIDKDGSGSITTDEFKALLQSFDQGFSEAEIIELVYEMDVDGDGQVSLAEFIAMMKKGVSNTLEGESHGHH